MLKRKRIMRRVLSFCMLVSMLAGLFPAGAVAWERGGGGESLSLDPFAQMWDTLEYDSLTPHAADDLEQLALDDPMRADFLSREADEE